MIILSAALDLVGPNIPKGVVLLCDVIPSFLMKLCAPYFIGAIPYSVRVILFVAISTLGMLLIALTPSYTDGGTIAAKMAGVVLASLSSGAGELSFLGLTHFYGHFSLASWGSGTGGAGLVGAGAYALATTSMGLSSRGTLFASAFLPIIMLISFFIILPRGPLSRKPSTARTSNQAEIAEAADDEDDRALGRADAEAQEEAGLLPSSPPPKASHPTKSTPETWTAALTANLRRSRSLFFP